MNSDAEARALSTGIRDIQEGQFWTGTTNTLTNYATLTAIAHAGEDASAQALAKSFGIYTQDWEGENNSLENYGDIHSKASGGSKDSQIQAFGIRTGRLNGK